MQPTPGDAEEAVPLQAEAPSCSTAPPSGPAECTAGEPRMRRRRRATLAFCTACLTLTATATGLALWRGTGRSVRTWTTDARAEGAATSGARPPIGECAAARQRRREAAAAPQPAVAAAEWWFALVAPYTGSPARADALAALRAQDAAEAAQAADRFACVESEGESTSPSSSDPARYALTAAHLASLVGPPVPGHPIAVTWCNDAFVPFALNWAAHARAVGLEPFAIGAADPAALEALLAAGLPTFVMPGAAPSSSSDAGWGTPAFHALGRSKAALAAVLTGLGYDALLCDVDTVWLADPHPFLQTWPAAGVLTSWDGLARTGMGKGGKAAAPSNATGLDAAAAAVALPVADNKNALEAWPAAAAAPANIGVMLWRSGSHPVAAAWRDALLAEPGAWDQDVFNDLLMAGGWNLSHGVDARSDDGLFPAFGRAAPTADASLAGVLPVDAFASGHTFFIQRMAERMGGPPPFVVHTTFQFSGSAGKRHRLRERWLWAVDGPDHYAPSTGLLTLGAFEDDPAFCDLLARAAPGHVPANATAATALAALSGHFALVAHQLRAIAAGLALATALNRTLVLPRLWCGADRWWQPFTGGAIPGTPTPHRLPFRCPADHVLDLAAMGDAGRRLDARTYGPPIPFREAGLLDNPRFPEEHKVAGPGGTLAVVVDGGRGESKATTTALTIPPGLDDVALRAALAPASSTPVLHFPDPVAAMPAGFRDREAGTRFARRVAVSTDLWCCVPGAQPGHVWYDALAGTAHTDRHGRRWEAGEWVPTTGP